MVIAAWPSMMPRCIGDSVAINGCCLTVIEIEDGAWRFRPAPRRCRTNLGKLRRPHRQPGGRPGERSAGGTSQGHIDGVGEVDAITYDGDWVEMWFRVPAPLTRQMVSKGSVAADGVSLTLVDVEAEQFSVR